MLTKTKKAKIIKETRVHDTDTGSPEVQIAVLTKRIDELASHLKKHKKDNHSRRGLLGLVQKRRRLKNYLQKTNPEAFKKITEELDNIKAAEKAAKIEKTATTKKAKTTAKAEKAEKKETAKKEKAPAKKTAKKK